jgi:hypothetical protein
MRVCIACALLTFALMPLGTTADGSPQTSSSGPSGAAAAQPWPPSLEDPTAPLLKVPHRTPDISGATVVEWNDSLFAVRDPAAFCEAVLHGTDPADLSEDVVLLRLGPRPWRLRPLRSLQCRNKSEPRSPPNKAMNQSKRGAEDAPERP